MYKISKIIFLITICLSYSCSTGISAIKYNIETDNVVEKSIFDFSKTKAKKFAQGTIFYVHLENGKKSKFVTISDGTLKHVYNNEKQMRKDNLKGKLKEVDNRLYLIDDDNTSIITDHELAIEYGYIIIDNKFEQPYYIDDLVNDDLAKVMTYIFCNESIDKKIKVYSNSWDTFRRANKKLKCSMN